jgi:excinuclease UvrABC helicase subunit UvrB
MSIMRSREIQKVLLAERECRNLGAIYNSEHSIGPTQLLAASQDAIEALREAQVAIERWQARLNPEPGKAPAELLTLARELSIMEACDDMRFEHAGNSHNSRDASAGVRAAFKALGFKWPEKPTKAEIEAWLIANDYEPGDFLL